MNINVIDNLSNFTNIIKWLEWFDLLIFYDNICKTNRFTINLKRKNRQERKT